MIQLNASATPNQIGVGGNQSDSIQRAANELEAAFLAEMLKSAGLGKTPEGFGGGVGEDQFASFLREAQAKAMVEAGGIGLAEHVFNALVKGQANDEKP